MIKEELYISYISKQIYITGTTTSDTTDKLIDSGALFITGTTPISENDLVFNTNTNLSAKVVSVDSDTQLTLSVDIFPTGSSPIGYKIYKKITERVELLKSLRPNITFNIADIAKPDQRKSDYSKTITLPGSKKLNQVFENIFEVNIDLQTFNPNLKTDVLYLVDGEINLDGYLQLKQVDILDNDDVIYKCTIIGSTANFIKALDDKEIDDTTMLWGNLDHDYTLAIQQASWSATTGYVYPMIDYGFSSNFSGIQFHVNQLFPAVYTKEYIDRMFAAAGFTYTSNFFDDDPFEKLIIPFNSKEFNLSKTAIEQRLFTSNTIEYVSPASSTTKVINPASTSNVLQSSDFSDVTMSVETDPNLVFDPATGIYTCNETGTYDFYFEVDLTGTFEPLEYGTGLPPSVDVDCVCAIIGNILIRHTDSGGTAIGGILNSGVVGVEKFNITYTDTIPNGTPSVTTSGASYSDNDYIETTDNFGLWTTGATTPYGRCDYSTTDPRTTSSQPNRYIVQVSNLYVEDTDKIKIELVANTYTIQNELNAFYYNGSFISFATQLKFKWDLAVYSNANEGFEGNISLNISGGVFRNRVVNKSYAEGNTIDMFGAIPKKVKQKDFFMSLVKMFNLYIEPDKSNEKHLFIEPRDDFYNNTIKDWSQKLDVSKQLEFLPMGALDSKEYLFTYKQDKDYYNELYNDTWGEIYGQRKHEIDNDFLNKEYKTEIIFSPTPSVGQNYHDRVIPAIKKYDTNNGNIRTESNIRILYYAGLKNCLYNWEHRSSLVANTIESQYPYAGHYSDPFTPTVDINFGLTKEIYYDDTFYDIIWSDNNLYNTYYKTFIEEITDVNSKIVKGWFYLRPSDIRNLSFKNYYFFDGAYFRLNKIENYNPDNPVTKCEFLKIKDADPFTPSTTTATGGSDEKMGSEFVPLLKRGEQRLIDSNFVSDRNIEVKGQNNYIDPSCRNVDINGDNNFVFANSDNVLIQGNGNSIEGASDVSLINTNDIQVVNSGVTYINGEIRGAGSIVIITSSTAADESIVTYEADTSGGSILVTLPSSPTIGKIWNFKKTVAANTLQLRTAGSETIDGAATLNITGLNHSYTVQYDGTNYIII